MKGNLNDRDSRIFYYCTFKLYLFLIICMCGVNQMKLCPYKAEGCRKVILNKKTSKTCGNPECMKECGRELSRNYSHNNPDRNHKYQILNFKSMNIRKKILRPCIGHYCRSEKLKWIHVGNFMCDRCNNYINDNG